MQKYFFIFVLFVLSVCTTHAWDDNRGNNFDAGKTIIRHVSDAHDFHIIDINGHAVSMPLPVILLHNGVISIFSSSEFHHDNDAKVIVEKNGEQFVKYNEKIYKASKNVNEKGQYISLNEKNEISNEKVLDFSITKNVFSLIMSLILLCLIFFKVSKHYKKIGKNKAPRGLTAFLEPLINFVIYDIAKANIGHKYVKFVPLLLTLFFFIWINNMIGLIPFFPFSANLTGNISFTMALALFSLLFTLFNGNKNYWGHILATPGVPKWLLPIMIPIELIGVLTKPFALMVRLFANITAGHIIILSLVSLIFILKTVFVSPVSVIFLLFMNTLELLVAFIQAYIFTMLTSMFIGQAVEEHH